MEPSVMRIYMPNTASYKGKRTFWQKIFGAPLAGHLLREAKSKDIGQALILRVHGGYLTGQKIAYEGAEVSPPNFPQCVELIDSEPRLLEFFNSAKEQMISCRVVLCQSKQVLPIL